MRRTLNLLLVTQVLLVAGCSLPNPFGIGAAPSVSADASTAPPPASSPSKSSTPVQSASATPTSTRASQVPVAPTLVDLGEGEWSWRGGALFATDFERLGEGEPPKAIVNVWAPPMPMVNTCTLDLWRTDEVWPDWDEFSGTDRESFSVMATTSAEPKVLVTFEATTPASGLNEQVTRGYGQLLDPETCALGNRIDLRSSKSGADSIGLVAPLAVGQSGELVVVETNYLGDLLAINPANGAVAWRDDSPGSDSEASELAPGYVRVSREAAPKYESTESVLRASDGTTLYATTKDEWIPEKGLLLAHDRIVLLGEAGGNWIVTPGKLVEQSQIGQSVWLTASSGEPVLVGFFPDSETQGSESYLGVMGADGAIKEVLSHERLTALGANLQSVSNGIMYLTTTSQLVAVDLQGQQVGNARDAMPSFQSVQDRILAGTVWTLWTGCGDGDSYCVSRDGLLPG